MCGIVGYVGKQETLPILLDGLRKLEYRGYDSAGVAVHTQDGLQVVRALGKIQQLANKLNEAPLRGTVGIGHTRWATHGKPSEQNAHPHEVDGVVVVHNGIIENHMDLRDRLQKAGHVFRSETDTEIVAHLVSRHLKNGTPKLLDAVRAALHEVTGTYAVGVMSSTEPSVLVVARKASPLVVGLGEGENFVASDIPAILSQTNQMLFLEEEEIALVTREGVTVQKLDGTPVTRHAKRIDWSPVMAEKGGHKHFMHKEIYEQPRAMTDTIRGRARLNAGEVAFEHWSVGERLEKEGIKRVQILACGTSYHAGVVGKYMMEQLAGVAVDVELASEFRYREPIIDPTTLIVAISQSGETADTLAAMNEAKRRGCQAIAICNAIGSTMSREANDTIYTHAGPEIGVASTKAFTTQLAVLYLLGVKLGRLTGKLDRDKARAHLQGLVEVPYLMEELLRDEGHIRQIAAKYLHATNMLFLGRGINYPIALEGALKLKELSYIHAEGYAAGEMKHGPIALIDEDLPVVVIAPRDAVYEKMLSNLQEVRARQGRVIALVNDRDEKAGQLADDVIVFPPVNALLQPMLSVLPLQLLAYHVADMRGTDVDQPRNLAKSVTVE